MKKIFYIFTILILFFSIIFVSTVTQAAQLDTVSAKTNKEKIAPGEEVKLTVSFGKDLGAYTVNAAYDNAIFEYVNSEGGTANNTGDKIILTYHDQTGGTNPRTNAVITFKAKESLTETNPTNFSITLEGMANSDASERYDDIKNPIIEDVLVEPNYMDYSLKLEYTGDIKKDETKNMRLITESTMGKNYDHVRLIAEVTTKPSNTATAKLLATKTNGNEVDLLQSGWGETDGYAIGGKNVKQELNLKGVFSEYGKYTIHIKLIDRDDSDKIIAQKSFDIPVSKTNTQKPITPEKPSTPQIPSAPQSQDSTEKLPATYPQTGIMQYTIIVIAIITLAVSYAIINKKNK